LKAATVQVLGNYETRPDGTVAGLDWELVRDFARTLGLKLEVTVPTDLKTFFSHEGSIPPDVETNPELSYTPDLLKSVDLYIGPFSILPWRERLMTMVPLYPMQNFLAGRPGEEIQSMAQLEGKRVVVIKDSMQEGLLQALATQQGLRIRLVLVSPEDDVFTAVLQNRADYTLDGGLFFSQHRQQLGGLSLSTFASDPVRVGWAMKRQDAELASLVRKYLAKAQENGTFVLWFQENLGTSFQDYLNLLATSLGTKGDN
jgi:ABC-type amino acid transport substrate-binding protein